MPVKTILLFRSKTDDISNEDIYEKVEFNLIYMADEYHGLIFTSKRAVEAVQQVLTDNDRKRWQRVYVEGPATSTLVKELFGSTVNISGAETGGGESLADFIIKDVHNIDGKINLLFPCAQARLDILPKRLSAERAIHLDEIIVYETIPSDSLDQELQEYLTTQGTPDVLGFFSPSGFDSVLKASQRIGFDFTNNKSTLISLGKTTSAAIRNTLGEISLDERSCSKPTAEEFLRVVQNII
ncbi:unnamed protein product [Adineta steineri]|uniref:Tetrapyrrole biosynthesis uroporphyrinogen III synthase domain-containing protein n=2 Tax=Adineta steineri TaxID=433720 RepID=A0A813MUU5_9BILA|nr:unnamed protein product [Adineta steineri]CAF3647810.1 unnamed protein product [Adineta steineri]